MGLHKQKRQEEKLRLIKSPRMKHMGVRNLEFLQRIKAEGIANLGRCYQCQVCTNSCPVAYTMDYYPHQLIHMVRLGLEEKVLQSKTIWVCASCETCATRCPNEIDIVRLMDVLRREFFQEGLISSIDEIPQFHKVFVNEIRRRGRVHELLLIVRYKLKTRNFFSLEKMCEDASLGLKMFIKGKFKLLSPKMRGEKEVKVLFKKVLSG